MRLMSKMMASAGVLALTTGVAAAAPAVVQNDLNLRAGPGTDYEVIAAMPAGSTINVMGCEASWCQVAFGDTTGYASRSYLGGGGPAAAGPTYGGESYGYGGVAPRYGLYDENGYTWRGSSPGYGTSGAPAYGRSYGYYEGERTSGNERKSGEASAARGERMSAGNANARGSAEHASEIRGANPMQNAPAEPAAGNGPRRGESAAEIQGANPMLNAKSSGAAGPSTNPRAEVRGNASQRRGSANGSEGANARATTGAALRDNSEDHGPNFIGPGKGKVDNH